MKLSNIYQGQRCAFIYTNSDGEDADFLAKFNNSIRELEGEEEEPSGATTVKECDKCAQPFEINALHYHQMTCSKRLSVSDINHKP